MNERLRVNPILCTGHGLCAELLPELIALDEWGYPIISDEVIPRGVRKLARRAITECPALALVLVEERRVEERRTVARPRSKIFDPRR